MSAATIIIMEIHNNFACVQSVGEAIQRLNGWQILLGLLLLLLLLSGCDQVIATERHKAIQIQTFNLF